MRFLSVCSGIDAASVAWNPLGWEAAAFSEIAPFPSAVLKHRFPDVPNLGDMTKFKEWPDVGPVQLIVGGTPCQSFSVAGLRKGLDDPRGNLMLVYLGLAARLRPLWLVWENVPGVLSSNEGRDFGTFLRGLGKCGYGFAYRVLDAQYFGLAQRRKRVFVVGHLGDWRRAAAVLLERHCLQGHPAPSREKRQDVAASLTSGAHPGSNAPGRRREDDANLVSMCLNGKAGKRLDGESETFITAPTLPARTTAGGGLGTDFDCGGGLVAGTLGSNHGNIKAEHAWTDQLIAHSLRGEGHDAGEDGTGRGTPIVPVAFQTRIGRNGRGQPKEIVDALTSCEGGTHADSKPHVTVPSGVRRLTPREAERLQGFPDDFTLVPYRGKPAADGPRYAALGNSIAVPVLKWIGERIELLEATLELSNLEAP